jgi:hypothetical protein
VYWSAFLLKCSLVGPQCAPPGDCSAGSGSWRDRSVVGVAAVLEGIHAVGFAAVTAERTEFAPLQRVP